MSRRKLILSVVQVTVSAVVAYVIFRAVDWPSMVELVRNADVTYMALAMLVVISLRVASALRWHISLHVLGINVGVPRLLAHIMVSHSFGYLTPGGVGSDVVRAYKVYSEEKQLLKISSTLVLERVLGVLSLVALSTVCLVLLGSAEVREVPFIEIIVLLFLAAGGAGILACAMFLSQPLRALAARLSAGLPRARSKLTSMFAEISGIGNAMVKAGAVSVLIQFLRCLSYFLIFMALDSPVDLLRTCAIIPVVFLLMLLPISIAGIGVREGTLVLYSGFLGVPTEQAVIAGLSFYFMQILLLVPGFAIVATSAVRQKSSA